MRSKHSTAPCSLRKEHSHARPPTAAGWLSLGLLAATDDQMPCTNGARPTMPLTGTSCLCTPLFLISQQLRCCSLGTVSPFWGARAVRRTPPRQLSLAGHVRSQGPASMGVPCCSRLPVLYRQAAFLGLDQGLLLGHVHGQVHHAVGVAPLVVIPGDQLQAQTTLGSGGQKGATGAAPVAGWLMARDVPVPACWPCDVTAALRPPLQAACALWSPTPRWMHT